MSAAVPAAAQTPAWLAPVDRLVLRAAREVQLLAALTPVDAHHERGRLEADLRSGRPAVPHWTYVVKRHDELRRALDGAEQFLARSEPTSLGALYAARVRELSVEAAMAGAAGTSDLARLAQTRFAPGDASAARAAAELCTAWLGESRPTYGEPRIASDDPDERSLLSRMRAAVGELRLPFAVMVAPSLAPLAATGDRTILVAPGRRVSEEDAVRTVLHEIEGHARPRARSMRASVALFRAGTARGIDHQEGRALLLEERAGLLGPHRRLQLAARHRAVETMLGGASFAEVASRLVQDHGLEAADAVVVAERVFRGSDGTRPGLGRERVYLESLVRVRTHLSSRPEDEPVLASGQVAVDAIESLRKYAPLPEP